MSPHRKPGDPYKRKDGLWVGAVTLPSTDGKRRRVTVSSKDYNTAVAELRKLRKKVAKGEISTTGNTTVKTWLEHWLENIQRPHIRPSTYRYYEGTVRVHLIPHLGGKRLNRLTPEDVRQMHKAVQVASDRNAQKAQQVLQRALKDAEAEGLIDRNVAAVVRKPKHSPEEKDALSIEVAAHVLRTAEASRDELASRWAVAFWTGARQAELLGLTWDHVDFDKAQFLIEWQLQGMPMSHGCGEEVEGKFPCGKVRPGFCPQTKFNAPPGFVARECHKSLFWTPTKTRKGKRKVPILLPLVDVLREHKANDGYNPHNLVWHHPDGRPWSQTEDAKAWKDLLIRAKVGHVGVHNIRHTTATLLQAGGGDEMNRMALMGHSSAASQRGYIHVEDSGVRKMLEVLNALTPSPPPVHEVN
jgi:integrase